MARVVHRVRQEPACAHLGLHTYMHIGLLVACGGGTTAQVEWYRYEVYVDGVACVWMARMWATRVGGAGVGAIALGSARGCVSDGAQMHASGRGMGVVVRVPLYLRCWAIEAC